MASRLHFPWVATVVFLLSTIFVAASFSGEHFIYLGRRTGIEARWSIFTERGRVIAVRHHLLSSFLSFPAEPSWRNGGGFSYGLRVFQGGVATGTVMSEHIAIPTYPLLLLSGLVLAWRFRQMRRMTMPGRYPNCGYDLRATPDRCPECGQASA